MGMERERNSRPTRVLNVALPAEEVVGDPLVQGRATAASAGLELAYLLVPKGI